MSHSEYSHLVRVASTDIRGDLKAVPGLSSIKGVDRRLAIVICNKAGIPKDLRSGYLNEDQIEEIESVLANLDAHGVPEWFHNRQRDRIAGVPLHLTGANLQFALRQDIDFLKRIKAKKGIRHALGLKTRGQRLRSNGRKGRTLGVSRKKA